MADKRITKKNNSKIDRRDKRLVYEIVFGVIRNCFELDYVLNHYLEKPDFIKNKRILNILNLLLHRIHVF